MLVLTWTPKTAYSRNKALRFAPVKVRWCSIWCLFKAFYFFFTDRFASDGREIKVEKTSYEK